MNVPEHFYSLITQKEAVLELKDLTSKDASRGAPELGRRLRHSEMCGSCSSPIACLYPVLS